MISALPIWMFMQYVAANDAAFIVIPTSFIDLTACIQIGGLTFENKERGGLIFFEGGPIFGRLQSIIFTMHHLTSHDKMTC